MANATRLDMIRAAAKKIAKKAKLQEQTKTSITKLTNVVRNEKAEKKRFDRNFDQIMDKMNESHIHWTDGAQYAEKYYGETYRETTKYDNVWD